MKRLLLLILLVVMLPMLSSCGTIYGAVVDERDIGTIKSDHEIKAKILKKFSDDELVGVLDFSVSSYRGHVYLIGEHQTGAQKNRAMALAKSVKGVSDLTPYLLRENPKSGCSKSQNLKLTARVKSKLIGDKDIWSTNIDVKTMQCVTVLWGLVGSDLEIRKAIAHAQSVDGVSRVKSFLTSAK